MTNKDNREQKQTKQVELPEEVLKQARGYQKHIADQEVRHHFIYWFKETIAQAQQESVKLAEKRVAVAYQKALLEVGKISPGLLQQINVLAYEALKGQND